MAGRLLFGIAILALRTEMGSAQADQVLSQKPALQEALEAIQREFRRIQIQYGGDRRIAGSVERGSRSIQWLRSIARSWRPADPEEGRGMRESLEAMAGLLRRAPFSSHGAFLEDIASDLDVKTAHCRAHGLGARQSVNVVTKRGGVEEVKGLEVLYLEKFFEVVPDAQPKRFAAFSSPATHDLVPGRYFFWARDAVDHSKAGPRKEALVGAGRPSGAIEVLAP